MPGSISEEVHLVYLGLGSNISPQRNIPRAIQLIKEAVQVITISKIWNTPAVGTEGPNFLNAAIAVQTDLSPERLKSEVTRRIEDQLGRVRTEDKNAPRPIDIDILIYDHRLFDPQIWTLVHLAVPLAELVPSYIHPETGETLAQTAQRLLVETPIIEWGDVLNA